MCFLKVKRYEIERPCHFIRFSRIVLQDDFRDAGTRFQLKHSARLKKIDAVRYSLDDHRPNIDAAQALGMHTVWFRDAGQCEAELERLLP